MKKFKAIRLFKLFLLLLIVSPLTKLYSQNVGIGIATPLDKLHVNGGTIRISNLASGQTRAVLADPFGRLIIAGAANSPDWTTTGNTGTSPVTNYIGTTDAADFIVKTNSTERIRVFSSGKIVIGASAMSGANDLVDVIGSATTPYALCGYISVPGAGVFGYGSGGGYGVRGESTKYGVFGKGDSVGVYGLDSVAGGWAMFGNQKKSGSNGIAAVGGGINAIYLPTVSVGLAAAGDTIGLFAKAKSTAVSSGAGTGIVAVGNGLGVYSYLGRGSGIAATGLTIGVSGFTTNGLIGTAGVPTAGGYFEDALGAGNVNTYISAYNGTTQYGILSSGAKSTVVKDLNENNVVMFCPEAPEVLFQDYGKGKLVNGFSHIDLDPVFAKNIYVSEKTPLRVFIQLEGNCSGVYVTNKSKMGFDVYELNGGTSGCPFMYTVIGNRIDQPNSKFAGIRFPEGPLFRESIRSNSSEVKAPEVLNKNTEQQ